MYNRFTYSFFPYLNPITGGYGEPVVVDDKKVKDFWPVETGINNDSHQGSPTLP
jgi:hypothetical protein